MTGARSFDFEKSSDPDLNHYIKTGRKGGLGVYLIRKVTDEVEYQSAGGVNELRMVKRYPKARPETAVKPEGMSIRFKFSLWTSLVMTLVIVAVYFFWESRRSTGVRSSLLRQSRSTAIRSPHRRRLLHQ